MIDRYKATLLQQQLALHEDEAAYRELFAMCFPALMRFAYTFIRSRELSEEIAADVMISVWNRRESLGRIDDFRLYLYVSTRNTALNYLKKQKRENAFSLDESAVWMKADDATPEQLFITAELFKRIQGAIQDLPPQCRLIYKLIKEDGLKYREVSELLQLSVKTIETQMGIATKRLYKLFRNTMRETASAGRSNASAR